ncbi:hypothetical protein CAPTEDRAFT_209017 [Capitella teleta]|uniref:Fibronectin type-III domain-containing protein n=1 Tax=Capitella teleta TaxID=283909 RepID=R7V7G3_CAPTE|nr:hypothetical protein CAPTEDRAFT_209017 [Capitella teleta]|eukprot:ELU11670.1 hypothetical protein CAPTEDRAFT_209017 [Capitella teleta]
MDCVYLVLLLAGSGSVLGGDPVMVFRCQAACLVDAQERGVPVVKDQDACSTDGDCDLCWKICEHLVQDPMNWAPVCDGSDGASSWTCPPGCQSACSFLLSTTTDPADTSHLDPFFEPAFKVIGESTIRLKWTRPTKDSSRIPNPYIFVCYWKQIPMPNWISFATTTSLSAEFTGPLHMYGDIIFKIQAIDREGIFAEMEATKVDDLQPDVDDYEYILDSTTQSSSLSYKPQITLEVDDEGFLWAEVLLGGQQPEEFVVMWMRTQCSVCDEDEQQRFAMVTLTTAEALNASVSLPALSFNSTYSLAVQDEHYIIYQETFQTTGCVQPESDIQCRDLIYNEDATLGLREISPLMANYVFMTAASFFCVLGVASVTLLSLQYLKLQRLMRMKKGDVEVASSNHKQAFASRDNHERVRELDEAFGRIKPIGSDFVDRGIELPIPLNFN